MTSEATGGPERDTVPPAPRRPGEPVEPAQFRPSGGPRLMTPAIAGSVVLLLVSALTSIAWVVANGGVALPPRAATPALAAASNPSGAALPAHGAGESGAPGNSPGGSPAAEVPTESAPRASTPDPTPGPSGAGPGPSRPVETPRPSPTSDRYAVLVPCPAAPDCYRYTVRAGDNLWSIARWFGVPLETVYERNPELRSAALRPGSEIVLPTPTR
jgi:hypothetical protein